MRESKEFRKGIHLLEWELKESFMKAEDCQTAARDLQLLRVTKELQSYLGDENHHLSKQQEIQTLEKTLEVYKNVCILIIYSMHSLVKVWDFFDIAQKMNCQKLIGSEHF